MVRGIHSIQIEILYNALVPANLTKTSVSSTGTYYLTPALVLRITKPSKGAQTNINFEVQDFASILTKEICYAHLRCTLRSRCELFSFLSSRIVERLLTKCTGFSQKLI